MLRWACVIWIYDIPLRDYLVECSCHNDSILLNLFYFTRHAKLSYHMLLLAKQFSLVKFSYSHINIVLLNLVTHTSIMSC